MAQFGRYVVFSVFSTVINGKEFVLTNSVLLNLAGANKQLDAEKEHARLELYRTRSVRCQGTEGAVAPRYLTSHSTPTGIVSRA